MASKWDVRKPFTVVLMVAFLLILFNYLWSQSSGSKKVEVYIHVDLNVSRNVSIFDTCPLMMYDPLDEQLRRFHYPGHNPKAGCTPYVPITVLENGTVRTTERAKGYSCRARCLWNDHDRRYISDHWRKLPTNETFRCDMVETECSSGILFTNQESYIHVQIYEKRDGNERKNERPHLYILLLDSVSSFMAKRALPKTLQYLEDELGAVQMEFLNKLGRNSRPNAFPLFFGKSVEPGSRALVGEPPLVPDWDNNEKCREYLDEYSYVLEEYRKSGYKTLAANDWDIGFPYYSNCTGFNRPEADHMWRQFENRMRESWALLRSHRHHCGESHLDLLEYMEKFMNSYPGIPKVCYVWPVYLAHDTLKDLYHADDQFLDFLKRNKKNLDNAFFFFMADHGPRGEGILEVPLGRYEGNNPMLTVSVPKRYRNTPIHEQLKNKSRQLMTHFDLHATFMDILKVQPSSNFADTSHRSMQPLSKGSSLFREWRETRNCRTLPIPSQYCLCQYNKTTIEDQATLKTVGSFLAEQLNIILQKAGLGEKCQKQSYYMIHSGAEMKDGNVTLYEVAVYVKPSNGLFSAHVRPTDSGLLLYSGLNRLNQYGHQADCVVDHPLKPLCHCYSY